MKFMAKYCNKFPNFEHIGDEQPSDIWPVALPPTILPPIQVVQGR